MKNLTLDDLDQIESLANAAEPGPYRKYVGLLDEGWPMLSLGGQDDGKPVGVGLTSRPGDMIRCNIHADADYFSALDPETVKTLVSLARKGLDANAG